ncbi:MAG: hypothetical protein M0T84_12775 [Betaproteobacteria bacterium]|nr:hypothetical protein [Betaproteobacteria bacterium]
MGYKRKARILFVSRLGAGALIAQSFAHTLGAAFITARAGACASPACLDLAREIMRETGLEPAAGEPLRMPDDTAIAWADLVVAMDAAADALIAQRPGGPPVRRFPLEEPALAGGDEYRALRERIRARVEGMVGGMRMLENQSEI